MVQYEMMLIQASDGTKLANLAEQSNLLSNA